MDLIPGEKMLMESDNDQLALTTHRVRFEGKKWGRGQITSIMLESLTSCEITYASQPVFLVIAASIAIYFLSQASEISAVVFLVGYEPPGCLLPSTISHAGRLFVSSHQAPRSRQTQVG